MKICQNKESSLAETEEGSVDVGRHQVEAFAPKGTPVSSSSPGPEMTCQMPRYTSEDSTEASSGPLIQLFLSSAHMMKS